MIFITFLIAIIISIFFTFKRYLNRLLVCDVNEVIHSWMKHDRYFMDIRNTKEIYDPTFNKEENLFRLQHFLLHRFPMWIGIPPDTTWYKTKLYFDKDKIVESEVECERIVNNETKKYNVYDVGSYEIAQMWLFKDEDLENIPSDINDIILFGRDNRFMILEGNHRVSRWMKDGKSGEYNVYIGISESNFMHHPDDKYESNIDYNWLYNGLKIMLKQ